MAISSPSSRAPFNLAILDTGAADRVIEDHPEIGAWAVGGHSLGGATAALFIDRHPGREGLVLWAAYSSADLSSDELHALSLWSLDAGVPSYTDPANLARLGSNVTVDMIEGGNHEQMGWYTGQPDDPPATISRETEQERWSQQPSRCYAISAEVALGECRWQHERHEIAREHRPSGDCTRRRSSGVAGGSRSAACGRVSPAALDRLQRQEDLALGHGDERADAADHDEDDQTGWIVWMAHVDQRVRPRIMLIITIRVAATFAVRITSNGQTAATRAASMPRLVVGTSTRPIVQDRQDHEQEPRPASVLVEAPSCRRRRGWVEGWVVGWVAGSVVGSVTPAMLVD